MSTIYDVAREAGVSISAVSYAINGKPGVAEATRSHILAVADRLNFQVNSVARGLATSQGSSVGLVLRRDPAVVGGDPFFGAFIAGVQSVLSEANMTLLIDMAMDESGEMQRYERLLQSRLVAGFLITDLRVDDPRLDLLAERRVPYVISGMAPVEPASWTVDCEARGALDAAVDHLVALGHQRIAYASGPLDYHHARYRLDTICRRLEQHGLELVGNHEGDFTSRAGHLAMTHWLAHRRPPSAVIFGNDLMAMGGCAAASVLGHRVPEDVSVIGFDNLEVGAHADPPLTSVTSHFFDVGKVSAVQLLKQLDGQSTDPERVWVEPAQLVVRQSSGPAGHR